MRPWTVFAALVAACGCGDQAPANRGLDAVLRIDGAQFYEGAMPAPNGGPGVTALNLPSFQVVPGARNREVTGALDPRATAALIGLVGDAGYWVLVAGAPDFAAPDFPTFDATMEFSSRLVLGDYALHVQAGDAEGRVGKPSARVLHAVPPNLPSGTLVVELFWDTDADLDLHVVVPSGVEVFSRNPNSVQPPPPGKPVDPNAWKTGGILDVDSNAQCVIDGRRQEDVIWTVPPPSGAYTVRVDTFSLCAAATARWTVAAVLDGRVIARAAGQSEPTDAEGPHDRGAGVLAFMFDVP